MKKYRLIKTYLNSPSLGAEVEEQFFSKCNLEHENFSEFWEEVVEKEYEILSFINTSNKVVFKKCEGGNFSSVNNVGKGSCTEEFFLNLDYFKINSVKRLSDNEIFTVGDTIRHEIGVIRKIHSIDIVNNSLYFNSLESKTKQEMHFRLVSKVEEILFTTEDGVDIYQDTPHYPVELKYYKLHVNARGKMFSKSDKNKFKIFSTKEAAERYILENKPCLSLKDVFRIYPEFKKREPTDKRTAHANQLIKIAKSKL